MLSLATRLSFSSLPALGLVTALSAQVPTDLPRPGTQPPDTTKPVQVYILAGQSNMVGMGDVGGAKNRYSGVYLSADPDAPVGPLAIHTVGNFRVRRLGLFRTVEPDAEPGAVASIHIPAVAGGASSHAGRLVVSEPIEYGRAAVPLPSVEGQHTVVVRCFLEVPESGSYRLHVGEQNGAKAIAKIDGQLAYRHEADAGASQAVELRAGERHALEVHYFEGGSTALWLAQENLQGHGDLESVVRRDGKFGYLVDDEGAWTVRPDVWFQEARLTEGGRGKPLTATSNGRAIGPELGFGHVVGTYHDEQVLLIKTAQGNRSLGFDFRPPSSGRTDPDNKWESLEWQLMVKGVRETLAKIDQLVPGYSGQGYELAGFAWWQGHKDGGSEELIAAYEQSLVHLIQDVRAEFEAPELPVVVATLGFGGARMADKYLRILDAQMAVGDSARHPEFDGTVASVDTRPFWREIDESPRSQDYHYHRNAETYLLVGEALGRAMVRLRGGSAEPVPEFPRPVEAGVAEAAGSVARDPETARNALRPILLGGIARAHVENPRHRDRLLAEARSEPLQRPSQFPRGALYGLTEIYRQAGVTDYDWQPFGPDTRNLQWHFHSFDPPEQLPVGKGARYRPVTLPDGLATWFATDFDAASAGFERGLPPFGQLDGELAPLVPSCQLPFCGCGTAPRTLWEHEVLLLRGTFDFPPLEEGYRYRLLLGGSSHVNAGEGFALYVNGTQVAESKVGVGRRQGGQPRGVVLDESMRKLFVRGGGPVTLAVASFLRVNTPRGPIPPRGHLSVWLEQARVPPLSTSPGSSR